MHRLIYVSSATSRISEAEITDILKVSRRNNARQGLTGVMIYHEGSFFQILEGEEDIVEGLFRRIAGDERHHGVIRLLSTSVASRAFPDWQMGFVPMDSMTASQQEGAISLISLAKGENDTISKAMTRDRSVKLLVNRFLRGFRDIEVYVADQDSGGDKAMRA